jgi:hypothetical protein
MRAQTLPPSAGWRWLADGYAIYRRNPGVMMALVAGYWLCILVLHLIPLLGPIVANIVTPVLSIGLMNACRDIEWGRPVVPAALFSGRRQNVRALLILGASYLACILCVLALTYLVDGGDLMRFILAKTPEERAAITGGVIAPLLVALLLAPLMMAWWFAPLLAAWHSLSVPKALFFSFVACWVNWRPFVIYGLAIGLFAVVLPAAALLLIGGIVPGAARFLTTIVSLPVLMVLVPAIFASFYVSYRDVFGVDERV